VKSKFGPAWGSIPRLEKSRLAQCQGANPYQGHYFAEAKALREQGRPTNNKIISLDN